MVELPAQDAASTAAGALEPSAGVATGQTSRAAVTYDAFISYSHAKDKAVATALQSFVQKLGKPWYRRRALQVFRDDTSLSATPHLWPSIEQAQGQSRFLILLASPEAAASRWVGQEVGYWLDHNSADTVLIDRQRAQEGAEARFDRRHPRSAESRKTGRRDQGTGAAFRRLHAELRLLRALPSDRTDGETSVITSVFIVKPFGKQQPPRTLSYAFGHGHIGMTTAPMTGNRRRLHHRAPRE
jgi:hypothetical protein